jgi:hypothetical protein
MIGIEISVQQEFIEWRIAAAIHDATKVQDKAAPGKPH